MNTWRKSKEFVCPYCEKDFDKERMLKSHIKDKHKDIKLQEKNNAESGRVTARAVI